MRILITGITGFVGSHLAEWLYSQRGIEIFGTYRRRSRLDNIEHLLPDCNMIEAGVANVNTICEALAPGKINLINADLTDAFSVRKVIGAVRPDRIFHLAAQSFVPGSWNAPAETLQTNTVSQLNLFEAVLEAGLDPLIQIAGSSEEYGMVYPDEVPMTERNPLRPLSPYAVSKVTQEMLAYQYFHSYGVRSVVSRGFNHTGPRRGSNFAESTFALQVARIEAGQQAPVIHVGDLTSSRDYTDVRDMIQAYWLLLEHCTPGEVYNIGTGVTHSMQEVLDTYLSMSHVRVEVRPDPTRMRPSDVKLLWADASKFRRATGWEPRVPFQQTLRDLLEHWRTQVTSNRVQLVE